MHAASQNPQPRAEGKEKKDIMSMFLLCFAKSMLLDVYRRFICFCSIPRCSSHLQASHMYVHATSLISHLEAQQ